ncbi:MAG: hypothetical protein M1419_03755 [Bacteroidetes bacterium]|nr:hypothetical protein [Bacteroidota bacterium]
MFTLPNETLGFGQILASDGFNYRIKLDNNTVTDIDSYNFLIYNFPAYLIKSVKWFNSTDNQYHRIYLENSGTLDCKIISLTSEKVKVVQSKYLVNLPIDLISWRVNLIKISDTTKSSAPPPHLIILKNDHKLKGRIISKTRDSVIMKVGPGLAAQISNSEIDDIYPNDYFARNVLYIDAASIIFVGYISANYDFMLNPFFSIRLGAGLGYELSFSGSSGYYRGVTGMMNFLPGGENSKFEFGIGASYVMEDREYYQSKNNNQVSVAFTIGYRYQNKYKGMLFRIGVSNLGYGGGLHLSLGYAF